MATTNFAVTLNTFANTTPGFYKYKEVKRDITVANGVLRYLANNGKSRCNDIADALNCHTQAISAMMRKLMEMGLVQREEIVEGTIELKDVPYRKKMVVAGITYYSEYVWGDIEVPNKVVYFSLVED